ncbi:sporulation integral membrane protein YtvI [Heliophilum fasciatum]|uniref:Sporulation integral membrane protein YtvI n=1 Tax=Heliophilum fasciatum TaxID=35700 RepID=A0A4R2RN97_9FIRM|nr:sporulation integral membrane protein YtvI [Heliophilum fasciatum]MCW2277906.1 sporulation integral membrane protein YtvI [Heliophilum fasciatum]TCP64524.1 sporulation integral membrane protein YtvI [Heliophilum fasciatum]
MNPWQDWLTRFLRLAIWALALVVTYFVIEFLLPMTVQVINQVVTYLLPFVLGAMIALLVDPIVDLIVSRTKLERGWATFISLILLLGLMTLAAILLIGKLGVELIRLAGNLPSPQQISQFFNELVSGAAPYYAAIHSSPEVLTTLQRTVDELLAVVKGFLLSGSNYILDTVASLPSFFTVLVFSLMASFFLSRDKRLVLQAIYWGLPGRYARQLRLILLDMSKTFMGFIRAQIVLISITALIAIIAFYLMQIEFSFTLGILVGLFDLLPILGPGLILLPWIIWESVGGNYALATQLAILYGILVLNRQFIEPKIVADSIGLHPLATLMALYIGMKAFGVVGVVLGPAVVMLLLAMYRAGVFHNFQKR